MQDLAVGVVETLGTEELLSMQSRIAATTMEATIEDEQPLQTAGHPGRSFRLVPSNGSEPMLVRSALVGRRFYVLIVAGTGATAEHPEVASFFGSFRTLPEAPAVAAAAEPTR